ncbi:type II secretion system protein [Desulfallas thermosapovorans]|uniref:Type IV pilus assembly protein PilA n=1 Tax=Desulfallas thermosapovorans DSM 6562 TaxID=1121431 RepID=A0A5S4ZQH6_9FIRM|nr:prepilin-type N-terminal cleavage/methylation domain-containing protein [Desulfallas thermosapovorans]TYO95057.1 type IV pilus assembly protein PilA [Desulfallas thermosapovorans DSM 6562]
MMFWKISKTLKNRRGFTLVELMVVVVIIGILAGIAVPKYGNITEKSERSAVEANLRTIDSAISMYRAANGSYPEDATAADDVTTLNDYLQEWPSGPGTAKYGIEEGRAIVTSTNAVGGKTLSGEYLPINWEEE